MDGRLLPPAMGLFMSGDCQWVKAGPRKLELGCHWRNELRMRIVHGRTEYAETPGLRDRGSGTFVSHIAASCGF